MTSFSWLFAGTDFISEQLVSEVNEAYLCHGTGHVNEIEETGIDSRFCENSALFGKGAYFAESSTKADQYASKTISRSFVFIIVFMNIVNMCCLALQETQ